MVVITIIAIMAAMMVVSVGLPDPSRDLRHEAERLRAVFAMASEEAVIQQAEIGVELVDNAYRFMRFERPAAPAPAPGLSGMAGDTQAMMPDVGQAAMDPALEAATRPRWVLWEGDETFRSYELPDGIRMQLQVDYEKVDMKRGLDERSAIVVEERLRPTVFFLSSGETSPCLIEIFLTSDPRHPLFVRADALGRVEVLDAPPRE